MAFILKRTGFSDGFNYRRPTNAFGEFVRLQTANTGRAANTRELSHKWNTCDREVKAKCQQLAQDKLRVYREQKEKYESSRLKRPRNGYNLFVQDFISLNKRLYDKASETIVAAAKVWNGLKQSEKNTWLQEAKVEREKYFAEKQRRIATGECIGKKHPSIRKAKKLKIRFKKQSTSTRGRPKVNSSKAARCAKVKPNRVGAKPGRAVVRPNRAVAKSGRTKTYATKKAKAKNCR